MCIHTHTYFHTHINKLILNQHKERLCIIVINFIRSTIIIDVFEDKENAIRVVQTTDLGFIRHNYSGIKFIIMWYLLKQCMISRNKLACIQHESKLLKLKLYDHFGKIILELKSKI